MRKSHLAVGTLALALAIGCDSKDSAKAEVDGKADAKAGADAKVGVAAEAGADAKASADAKAGVDAAVHAAAAAELEPQIGGTIVAAGEHNVEVLAFVDGRIEAVVLDAEGRLVADAGAKLGVKVTLAAEGDAKAVVALKWDPPSARFVGRVEAGVVLVPGPLEVALEVDGKASIGTLARLGLAAEASHGGQIMVAGDHSFEVVAQGELVHAYAFDASAKAHAAGDLDLSLELDGGAKLDLEWDPPSASYKGKIEGKLDLEAKPLVVRVTANGKVVVAAVASFAASNELALKGKLDASADVRPPDVKADAHAGGKAGAAAKGSAKASGSAKAGGSGDASIGGKASAKIGGGAKAGAKAGGKAKAGFKIGG
jgi:hypothetical protein